LAAFHLERALSTPTIIALAFANFATGFLSGLIAVGHYCS